MSRTRPRRLHRVLPLAAVLLAALLVLVTPGANAGSSPWYEQSDPQAKDSEINVTGEPAGGESGDEVRGFIDAHTHLMSNEGFGGDIVCGKSFSELGIEDALTDCDSHGTDGRSGLIENLTHLEGKGLLDAHSTELWPSFKDAPTWSSLTHQQMYYKWVERAWRGGQRVMVADAVNNNVLCALPLGQVNTSSCDDMDTVRRQIAETKQPDLNANDIDALFALRDPRSGTFGLLTVEAGDRATVRFTSGPSLFWIMSAGEWSVRVT